MRIWKSSDGSRWINLDHLSMAHRRPDNSVCVFMLADSDTKTETATLRGADAESFLAAAEQLTAAAERPAQPDAYRAMVIEMLASARPHPVEHPTMAAAWAHARELLRNEPSPVSERPWLTADEVRLQVGHAAMDGLIDYCATRAVTIDGQRMAHGDAGKLADAIADRVAEKLAGRALAAPPLDPAKLETIFERLDNLDGDMATVGGQRLVEVVRDLAKLIMAVRP